MTGCAGGLSGGLWAAFGAELRAGAEYVFALLDVPARLSRCDAAVTGEGRFDSQSLSGKVIGALADLCRDSGTELHVIAGASTLDATSATGLGICSLQLAGTRDGIRDAARRVARREAIG
jgi:glycerate kinase